MMDNLIKDLTSSEIAPRLAALEKTATKLPNKNWLRDVSSDLKMKLMSSTINAVKDSNPKVVGTALNCVGLLIRNHKEDFSPLINMSFEILLGKLGDNKTNIRELSLQVLLELVSTMSAHATFERITANISHKNQRVKEGLLVIVTRLQEVHGSDILRAAVGAQTMCTTLAVLLNDAQAGTRQLAVSTLAGLYPTYREELMDALSRCEVRPAQEKAMLEALYLQRQRAPRSIAPANSHHMEEPSAEVDPWSLLDDEEHDHSSQGVGSQAARGSTSPSGSNNIKANRDFAQTSRPASQQQKRSVSATPRRPTATSNAISTGFGSTMGASSLASSLASDTRSNSTFAPGDTLGSNGTADPRAPTSAYDPEGFMHFIQLKAGQKATEIVDERDLQKIIAKIGTDLAKKNDWEARTNALVALQKLAWGNIGDFKQSVELIRAMHDLVSAQIIELRSAVSKEACRAVAALAFALRQQFSPLAETWWMHLVRVVVVKIQVISSSADKCIRVMVASCPDQRLLVQIMESCTAKAPPLRKLGLEYLCLACAAWKPEAIEKNATALKQVVKAAVADSDAAARKTARQLFWVLHNNPGMQPHMKKLLKDLDVPTQKHLQTEARSDSAEMTDLFRIVQNPSWLLECVRRTEFNSSSKSDASDFEPVNEPVPAVEKTRTLSSTSTGMRPPTRTSARGAAAPLARASTVPDTVPSHAPKPVVEEMISEFDCLMQDELTNDGIASSASSATADPVTAMKASRRMSLTGPLRVLQPAQVEEFDTARPGTAVKNNSLISSRRQTLSSTGPAQGRSLARSTDFSSTLPVEDSTAQTASTVLSVSSLLQTLGAPLTGSSLIGGGAVRNSFEAKTPAVKTSYTSTTSTRPSFITRQEALQPPLPDKEEAEMPSHSQSFAVPADAPDVFASEHFSDAPALPSTTRETTASSSNILLSRRSSLGSMVGSSTSALGNGPKRIVRAAPAVPAAPVPVAALEDADQVLMDTVQVQTTVQKSSAFLSEQVSANVTEINAEVEAKSSTSDKDLFIFSGETLRTMVADEHWDARLNAFESINMRLQRASSTQESLNEVIVETFVDLSLSCLADPHQKVATEALTVLQGCVAAYPQNLKSRLGAVLLALFHRLADRRPVLRDQANSVLNLVRTSLDPVLVMTALSPRMGEVPDRMKTALMQFMGAVAPHCDAYFQVPSNTWAFLSRMAHIIGSSGAKPSLTLTVAARRLLELVFKTSPQVICAQIAALPLQQLITLKKYLEASIPDIDHQVTLASRAEWSSKVPLSPASAMHAAPSEDLLDVSTMSSVFEIRTASSQILVKETEFTPAKPRSDAESESFLQQHDERAAHATSLSISSPLPSPIPASVQASPQRSPGPPAPPVVMEFTPRNLSAAAVEVEVRVREYLDALHHAQSPSENVSPNSPPASSSRKVALSNKVEAYSPRSPVPFVSAEDPVLNAVLVSRQALDAATEEIIQRYSPKSLPSSHGTPVRVFDPLDSSLTLAYGDHAHDSAILRNTVTPQRPSQLPQRRSLATPPTNSVSQTSSPESTEPLLYDTLSAQKLQDNRTTPQKEPPSGTKRASPLSTAAQFADHNDVMRTPSGAVAPSSSRPASSNKSSQHASLPSAKSSVVAGAAHGAKKSDLAANGAKDKSSSAIRDTLWLLEHLKPSAALSDRAEASKDLKQRIKSASESYWMQNYAQIVTVLLDSFRADVCSPSVASAATSSSGAGVAKASLVGYEHVEFSTKSLLVLMRYRAPHMKNLIEVLADKLCRAGEFVPQPIAQSLEMILSELSKQDAVRLVTALLPYATLDTSSSSSSSTTSSNNAGENPQVRILALHALCASIKHLSSAQLLSLLPTLVPAVLSSVNSSLADLRKAVIFILVEVYLSVGDSVFPFVSSLTPPQRKLLTIYIEKRLNERKQSVANALNA